ncbi:hypothetical protein [Paenibacillus gansuensis]|uniref:Secreted protein n=1 Tax=Paenibacillus gansuensis TaxID=306542 RepID=A0ABW5PN07_9BACL
MYRYWKSSGIVAKSVLGIALLTAAAGCNNAGPEIQQEQQEDLIDEREDDTLNTPGGEYRQEQQEDRMDEEEDAR